MKFYLSGGMEYKKNLGANWREWITEELEKHRHDAINPVKLEIAEEETDENAPPIQVQLTNLKLEGKMDEVRRLVRKVLFRKDMYAIQESDAIIVLYDESTRRGAGTLSEAWEAFREGRPVYLVTEFDMEEVPTWLIGETTKIFDDFEDLLEYVADHSHVIRDKMNAGQIAHDVLGGLY
jgi:nucleoside 2-deoxyribosyltransferase